mmetsp:Transcript_32356/g.95334  ORF Transcript_32356/g.95334 Transcript_32356/m.95334 type:complete len:198 (+) Transcript_32356:170-763(+)
MANNSKAPKFPSTRSSSSAVDEAHPSPSLASLMTTYPTKTVRFCPREMITHTLDLSDYTDEEYDSVWTTEDEEARSRQQLAQTLQMMRAYNGDIPKAHEDEFTSRGLEYVASTVAHQRAKESKRRVINTVLDEQERQVNERNHAPTGRNAKAPQDYEDALATLASLSMTLSSEARDHALDLASSDAATALTFHFFEK